MSHANLMLCYVMFFSSCWLAMLYIFLVLQLLVLCCWLSVLLFWVLTTYLLLHENFIIESQFCWPQNNWWEIAWQRSSIGATIALDCPRGSLDKLGVNKGLNSNRDQPSPTSVLDAPSEESSCNEPETSGRTSKNTSKVIFPYHSSPLLRFV